MTKNILDENILIGERLKKLRVMLKMGNQAQFSAELDINQSTLSKYENGTIYIPDKLKIILGEKGINLHWLLTGNGEMLMAEQEKAQKEEMPKTVYDFKIPLLTREEALAFEPEHEIPESMANSGIYPDATLINVPRRILEYSTDLRAIEVFDSRMTPVLKSGDIAIFEATGWNGNGIYLYRMSGGLHISYAGMVGEKMVLHNEIGKKIIYDAPTFQAIGRVRAFISDLFAYDWKDEGKDEKET